MSGRVVALLAATAARFLLTLSLGLMAAAAAVPTPAPQPRPVGSAPSSSVSWALGLASLALAGVAVTTLAWILHAWRTPQHLEAAGFARSEREPSLSFSLLVPARHEEEVLGDTLDKLAQLDHPAYEVPAIVGHDDPGTEAVARAAAARHPEIVRVVMDYSVPKNKPRGMNTALPECQGDIVGDIDAEDEVHPELLRLVDGRSADTRADVVQGGVQLMNIESSWWALRNCMEYYFWIRSRLHFHAGARFIPLGGNTVLARADGLREVGGWDPECLAEDCELGVRLSTRARRSSWPTTRTWSPARRRRPRRRACTSSAPAGTKTSSRCCARVSGASCPAGGNG